MFGLDEVTTSRVTGVEHFHSFHPVERLSFAVERMSGTPTRLNDVPLDKLYRVERSA